MRRKKEEILDVGFLDCWKCDVVEVEQAKSCVAAILALSSQV